MPRQNELRALARIVESDEADDALDDLSTAEAPAHAVVQMLATRDPDRVEAFRPLDDLERARIVNRLAPRSGRKRWAAGGLLLVAAAAVMLVWLIPRGNPTLPEYAIELEAGASARSASDAIVQPGARIEIRLRPARAAGVPVHAAFFVREGSSWRPLAVSPEIAASGAVRVTGVIGEGAWRLAPGRVRVLALVSPAEIADANDSRARRFELDLDQR